MKPLPALVLVALLSATTAPAAPSNGTGTGQPVSNDTTFNYGLSSFLGSGIYSVSGQAVQLYRVPVTIRLGDDSAPAPEFYAQFPVTFGFYNFTPEDVLQLQVPHSLDTVSGLAGLETRLTLNEQWRYLQLGAVGYTKAAGQPDKRLIGTQVALERISPWGDWNTRYRAEVLDALSGGGPGGTDTIVRLLQGVEFDRPQSWQVLNRQAAIGTYGVVRYYPGAVAFTSSNAPVRLETEAGLTFGTAEPIRVLTLPLPRLSLGYRRAANLNVFFLGFGTPF